MEESDQGSDLGSSGYGEWAWESGPYVMGPWHCCATSSSNRGGATSLQK